MRSIGVGKLKYNATSVRFANTSPYRGRKKEHAFVRNDDK